MISIKTIVDRMKTCLGSISIAKSIRGPIEAPSKSAAAIKSATLFCCLARYIKNSTLCTKDKRSDKMQKTDYYLFIWRGGE